MAKNPNNPKKPVKTPKSKAHRPDWQPIGPALAELLNPAINRGDAGLGSGTGLKPPPDNSWERRAGGEAAAHRAPASARGAGDEVAKRDTAAVGSPTRAAPSPNPTAGTSRVAPSPNPPIKSGAGSLPQAGEGSRSRTPGDDGATRDDGTTRGGASFSPPPVRRSPRAKADGGEGSGGGGGSAGSGPG